MAGQSDGPNDPIVEKPVQLRDSLTARDEHSVDDLYPQGFHPREFEPQFNIGGASMGLGLQNGCEDSSFHTNSLAGQLNVGSVAEETSLSCSNIGRTVNDGDHFSISQHLESATYEPQTHV